MSESPPPYVNRVFVCKVCKTTFEPSPAEAEALLALERHFGLVPEKCEGVCEECQGRKVQ